MPYDEHEHVSKVDTNKEIWNLWKLDQKGEKEKSGKEEQYGNYKKKTGDELGLAQLKLGWALGMAWKKREDQTWAFGWS